MRRQFAKLAAFQAPILGESLWQFGSTLAAYVAVVGLMYLCADISAWIVLPMAVLAAGLVVRLFIIQHDCGHGSFFRARRANLIVGCVCSLVTFTPFASWRRQHSNHHAVWNNLDRRDHGADIYSSCHTLQEYLALSGPRRALYRLVRHPLVAQLLLPPLVFLVIYRLPFDMPRSWRNERRSVHLTNLGLAALLATMILLFGVRATLLVQLPIMVIASIIGVWLFSVQHRFEESLWARQEAWDPVVAALGGSSYLRLPRVLQWFTGSIGFHHIHHLMPRVPNYRLEACHGADPEVVRAVTTLNIVDALRAPTYALWDEDSGRMVRFPA
jgi:omega-6 fatty acid desaturase (delta-12 desaturase)